VGEPVSADGFPMPSSTGTVVAVGVSTASEPKLKVQKKQKPPDRSVSRCVEVRGTIVPPATLRGANPDWYSASRASAVAWEISCVSPANDVTR
jgi:hypothetical protein